MRRHEAISMFKELFLPIVSRKLSEHGFSSKRAGVVASRELVSALQSVEWHSQRPTDAGDPSDLHISAEVRIAMPDVTRLLEKMLGGRDHRDFRTFVMHQNGGRLCPQGRFVDWQPSGVDGMLEAAEIAARMLQDWIMPFMDRYTTPEAVVAAHEAGDPRVQTDVGYRISLCAAYVAVGRPHGALQYLEAWCGSRIGMRRTYAIAFDYIERYVASHGSDVTSHHNAVPDWPIPDRVPGRSGSIRPARYEADGSQVTEVVHWDEATILMSYLEPNLRPFCRFQLADGSYIQCAGSKQRLTVEVHSPAAEGGFEQWTVGVGPLTGQVTEIECAVGPITVDESHVLDIDAARELFRAFLTYGALPDNYVRTRTIGFECDF